MGFVEGDMLPPAKCAQCVVRRQALFTPLSDSDLEKVQDARSGIRCVKEGNRFPAFTNGNATAYMTVHSGWAMRCRSLEDGQVQILSFLLPGAFVDGSFETANGESYWIEAITDVQLCVFTGHRLEAHFTEVPSLSRTFAALVQNEEAVLMEHLADVGRRDAAKRIAHFLLETFTRLKLLGHADENVIFFPLRQQHLADALGLSLEHVNRMLRELREREWISIKHHRLHMLDLEAMSDYCDFHPGYLTPRPIL